MDALVVVPPHVRVELAAQLVEARENLAIYQLLLQDLVRGLDDCVVVWVALAGEGPPDPEDVQQLVDVEIVKLAAADAPLSVKSNLRARTAFL